MGQGLFDIQYVIFQHAQAHLETINLIFVMFLMMIMTA